MKDINRRHFIKVIAGAGIQLPEMKKNKSEKKEDTAAKKKTISSVPGCRMTVIKGRDHLAVTRRAVGALGGMAGL